jgi:hypothetical protein
MSESNEGWAERRAATQREWERIIGEIEATGMTEVRLHPTQDGV